jgi:anti-sigma-K factor RskA
MTQTPENNDDLLAAEYVVGVLALDERLAFDARLKSEPALERLVAGWQSQLSGMNAAIAPVAPSINLLPLIEARLFPTPARKLWFATLWAAGGAAAMALAIALVVVFTPPTPTLRATLAAKASEVRYLVEVSSDGIALTLSGPAASADRSHELWLIVGDAAPVSLGVIGSTPILAPEALLPGMTLAVTLEPEGGSSSGAPTGPVLALGPLEILWSQLRER